ncbi:MAG: phosphonate C-P lyase system protein PhnG [Treponema sp.]|nr:phosphonate C-P lyase system protein PhnG [Treponema sp.]
MDKRTLSRISTFADTETLSSLAEKAAGGRELLFLKQPEKTMVLLSVREPVKHSEFYLGEMLAVHCIVELAGVRGAAVLAGDDFSKAVFAAMLDAAHSGGFAEFALVEPELLLLEEKRQNEKAKQTAAVKETQVRFHVLEDRNA